jgi:hypothetical protein
MLNLKDFLEAGHWSRTRSQEFLEFGEEREGGRILFSKAYKSLYRRRFKNIEDAPLAAYYFISARRQECLQNIH